MSKLIETIFEHPIATVIIIAVFFNGLANVITAIRGNETKPAFSVTITDERTNKIEETKGE